MHLDKIINTAYSIGAAVVVFGAWAKLEHKDYSSTALTTGLMTETAIFLIYGILEWRPNAASRQPEQLHPSVQPPGPLPHPSPDNRQEMDELTSTMKQTNRILTKVFRAE
jgi:hypothetical protein